MVKINKDGDYICYEKINDGFCGEIIWHKSSPLDYKNLDKYKTDGNGGYVECPKCGKKHYIILIDNKNGQVAIMEFKYLIK